MSRKTVIKWLVVDHLGNARVLTNRPGPAVGEAVYKLNLAIPAQPSIAGTIDLIIPDGVAYDVAVEQIGEVSIDKKKCPTCDEVLERVFAPVGRVSEPLWHWMCPAGEVDVSGSHGRFTFHDEVLDL